MLKVRAFSSKNFILQETPRDIESRKAEVSTVISSSSRDAKENCLCLENHSLRSGEIAEFANPDVSSNLKSCIESETSDEAAVIFHQQRQVEGRVFVFSARDRDSIRRAIMNRSQTPIISSPQRLEVKRRRAPKDPQSSSFQLHLVCRFGLKRKRKMEIDPVILFHSPRKKLAPDRSTVFCSLDLVCGKSVSM